jgi:hypothetical protein
MRKVIRKRIRRSEDGLNIAADVDAAIAINTGEDAKRSETVVRSSHRVVQGVAGGRDQPDGSPDDPEGPPKENR